ncbi:hypothetical protein D0T87_17785 [Bacteroides sp. 51]|nr:hypothetical protein [Bacteroides sp. 51]
MINLLIANANTGKQNNIKTGQKDKSETHNNTEQPEKNKPFPAGITHLFKDQTGIQPELHRYSLRIP